MKSKKSIKSIVIMAAVSIISLFFINMSLAANTAKVSVETARLRETPSQDSKILELLSMNEQIEIIEKTDSWYKVKVRGITGYLREDLITVTGEVTETSNNVVEEESQVENNEVEQVESTTEIELGEKIVIKDTKLKIVPVINATDIIEVKKDEKVNVIEVINGWVCVETQTTKGWIRKENLKEQEPEAVVEEPEVTVEEPKEEQVVETVIKTLFVNSTTVNLRKEASTSSAIIVTLPVNTAVDVLSEENGWSKVKVSGKEGYISSALLSDTKQETSRSYETPRKNEEEKNEVSTTIPVQSGKGNTVVETAQKYKGSSYAYGGSSPSGFDCSGFTAYVYNMHGVSLNRTAAGQYSNGVSVSKSDLQPGDLVMFGKSGINHVGIYIGGGQMIHAANPDRGVTTDTINSGYYYDNYVGARRVI